MVGPDGALSSLGSLRSDVGSGRICPALVERALGCADTLRVDHSQSNVGGHCAAPTALPDHCVLCAWSIVAVGGLGLPQSVSFPGVVYMKKFRLVILLIL